MIYEEKKDLIDRKKFYQLMVERMNQKYDGATLNSSLGLWEILEILQEVPLERPEKAKWIDFEDKKVCSWCLSEAFKNSQGQYVFNQYCTKCGSLMLLENSDEGKN